MLNIFGLKIYGPIIVALIELLVLIAAWIFFIHLQRKTYKDLKNPPKNGGDITINRNDPTKDYWEWEFASLPTEWKEGDRVIFTIHEHSVKEE